MLQISDLHLPVGADEGELRRKIAKQLGVPTLIGTKCDVKTGALIGKNCKGEEKLRRIEQNIGPFEIRAMYTDDAKADGPLLAAAQEGYIVTHGALALFQG